MSKISVMGIGGSDPITRTKRVVWRPVTASTVVKVGQPVCYNSDLAADYKERTTTPIDDGTAYAEGSQNYNARLFIVEEPLTANLHAFAGIVAKLGSKAGADGDFIEIYIPVEGSIVPVYTDENCTLDRTILGIRNAEVDVTYPGRAIGVAEETVDRSGADGLCWMKFKSFSWEAGGDRLRVEDEATTNSVIIHKLHYRSLQTGGAFTVLEIDARCDGGGGVASGGQGIAIQANAQIDTTVTAAVTGSGFALNFTDGTPTENITALRVSLMANADVTMTSAGRTTALTLALQITNDVAANSLGWVFLEQNGAQQPDDLILGSTLASLPAVAFTGDVTIGSSAGDYAIKVYLANQAGTQQWYIPLVKALS